MAMTIKVNGAVFEFDEVSEYLEFAEATGLEGLPEEDSSGTPIKEPLGKDANGEDLYEGDYVTGSEGNDYAHTNVNEVMEIVGAGESPFFEEANIKVRIVGDFSRYSVDSTEFIKLSDNLDEAQAKFDVIKGEEVDVFPTEYRTGDIVKVTETFEDSYGDVLYVGDLHRFGKLSSGRVCVSAVFVDGDNLDKLQLVCRREDREDVEL